VLKLSTPFIEYEWTKNNLISVILVETLLSLNHYILNGKRAIRCRVPLLFIWIVNHLETSREVFNNFLWFNIGLILNEECRTRHRGGLKNYHGKEWIFGILFFDGEWFVLRSHHLVLWLLGTLTGQQRFYGTRLVTQKGRYYHPLNVLPEADCIAGFVINC
jgi:hypothetical protein